VKAMIFTAGIEGKLEPGSSGTPRALVEINNEPLLGMLIRRLSSCGFSEIIINVHHFAGMIIDYLKENKNFGIRIEVSMETDLRLETGGGLKSVEWFFDDDRPFLLHNLEILSDIDLGLLYSDHIRSGALATLVVRNRESARFMLFNDRMQLCGWENMATNEIRDIIPGAGTFSRLAFSRIQVINPQIFMHLEQHAASPLTDLYLELAAGNLIRGYLDNESIWMDLGRHEGIIEAEKFFLKN
jgi:NDP-sugar pyrophosphorylase family protein